MADASARIDSTGRRAAPTTSQITPTAAASATGPPIAIAAASRASASFRSSSDAPTNRIRPSPPVTTRIRAGIVLALARADVGVDERRRRPDRQGLGHERRITDPPGGGEDAPVGIDHLRERLVGLDQGRRRRRQEHAVRPEERVRPRPEPDVDGVHQIGPQAEVEERTRRGEHDRDHQGGHEREPRPDRQAHAAGSERNRYPDPRTVSIESRPNGRSTLFRRYRT